MGNNVNLLLTPLHKRFASILVKSLSFSWSNSAKWYCYCILCLQSLYSQKVLSEK